MSSHNIATFGSLLDSRLWIERNASKIFVSPSLVSKSLEENVLNNSLLCMTEHRECIDKFALLYMLLMFSHWFYIPDFILSHVLMWFKCFGNRCSRITWIDHLRFSCADNKSPRP